MILIKPLTILNKFCQTAWGTITEILSGTPSPVTSWGFRLRFSVIFLRHLLKHHRGTSLQDARDIIRLKPDFTTLPYHKINVIIPSVFREKAYKIVKAKLERELGCYPADESTNWKNCPPLRAEWITSNTEYPCDHHTLLYFHGGGFILGSIHSHRHVLRRLTKGANCQVLAVDYRLAPEHPFPCGLEDCLATYLYLTDQSDNESFPGCCINPSQVILGGDCSGANLATALTLLLRDDPGLEIPQGLMLWSPWIDLTNKQNSFYSNVPTDLIPIGKNRDNNDLERSTLLEDNNLNWKFESDFIKLILFGSNQKLQQNFKFNKNYYTNYKYLNYPLVSPIFDSKGLRGLPPTFIQVGDREILRDEAILMAELLTKCHINTAPTPTSVQPVAIQIYQDMPHSFQILQFNRISKLAIHRSCSFLRQCFVTDTPQFFHTKMYHPIDGTQPTFIKSKKLAIHQHNSFDGLDRFIYWASIDGVICVYKHGYFLKGIDKWNELEFNTGDNNNNNDNNNNKVGINNINNNEDEVSYLESTNADSNNSKINTNFDTIELTDITIINDEKTIRPASSQLTLLNSNNHYINNTSKKIFSDSLSNAVINDKDLEKIIIDNDEFNSNLSLNNAIGDRIIEL